MTSFYLIVGCLLLLSSSLLLRKASTLSRWLSLVVLVIAMLFFVMVYGVLGGVFVAIAAALLIGLLTAFVLGKVHP
ncbi:hypothetical protein J8L70_11380 [Pseudoalteromonas sp. MMG010]|uniref:hypothetical protein n=1 Tax=Pseudoalteromonas sp. MMG010 TaxID=2822685 RepID=UPI001B3A5062|nr:hypothetical protein [Pseudoalteromonas sp. MMG010]MBQ4833843.1 hypothetical protein [Pseudoalteromonas sp. MMG010]